VTLKRDCGHESQTIRHIITECPIGAFKGTVKDIHLVEEEAEEWMRNSDTYITKPNLK